MVNSNVVFFLQDALSLIQWCTELKKVCYSDNSQSTCDNSQFTPVPGVNPFSILK